MMQYFRFVLFSTAALSGMFCASAQNTFAQSVPQAETPQTAVVMTKLSPVIFPPLARMTNIDGDVKVELAIRKDGSVESAVLFSGHPMLASAALDSARQSQFECKGCTETLTSYLLTYTFRIKRNGDCCGGLGVLPVVSLSAGHVTIERAEVCICDPEVTITRKVRTAKCLYLWKCATH
jgi:TonB family protein